MPCSALWMGINRPLRQTRYSPGYFASAAPRPPHLTLTDDRIWLHMLSADNVSHPPCSSLFHSPDQTARPTYSATVLARLTHPSPVATYPSFSHHRIPLSVTVPPPSTAFSSAQLQSVYGISVSTCCVLFYGWGSTGRSDSPFARVLRPRRSSPAAPNPYRRPYLAYSTSSVQCHATTDPTPVTCYSLRHP
jgi:hypothetical protein